MGFSVTLPFKGATFRWTATSRQFFLSEWALQEKFTIVGTMCHDRKGIPKEVKAIGNREEKLVLYVYHKEKEHHAPFSHRQEKVTKKECHRPFDNVRHSEIDERPKKEAPDPQHVRSHERRR